MRKSITLLILGFLSGRSAIASTQAVASYSKETHCQYDNPPCDSEPPQLSPQFFRPPSHGCDWSRSLDGCPLPEPQLLENHSAAMGPMAHRNYYFLGNSVTRHYAFTLRDFLSGAKHDGHTTTAARLAEKHSCAGGSAVGMSSCDLPIIGMQGAWQGVVKFMWKNYIGNRTLNPPLDRPTTPVRTYSPRPYTPAPALARTTQ